MVLESNLKNDCLIISFNSPKTSNSISAEDWQELKKQILDFEKSDTKYLVLNRVNDNFSSGAQLAENLNASMEDVSEASKMLWECKKPVISVVDGVCAGAATEEILKELRMWATRTMTHRNLQLMVGLEDLVDVFFSPLVSSSNRMSEVFI